MKILFTKSKWEAGELGLEAFLDKLVADGFDGSELYLAGQTAPGAEIRRHHEKRNLKVIAQVVTFGKTPAEHLAGLEAGIPKAGECGAILINSHIGSDFFTLAENLALYARAGELAAKAGIPLVHEVHRGRPTGSAVVTRQLLEADPKLRLTADFSHWVCVHESLLEDRRDWLAPAIARADHIHARVGFPEGPQASHPFAPENAAFLAAHLAWWKEIVAARRAEGKALLCITPEAGPPDYMPVLPFTKMPVADAWQVNLAMKDFLKKELGL